MYLLVEAANGNELALCSDINGLHSQLIFVGGEFPDRSPAIEVNVEHSILERSVHTNERRAVGCKVELSKVL